MKIVCAGDGFITPDLLMDALRQALGDGHAYVCDRADFPDRHFQDSEEVKEWSGDEMRLRRLVQDADVLVTHCAPVTEAVIQAGCRLRLIGCCRGGPVNVNLAAATRAGIPVVNTPERNARATAEHTVALLLAGLRHLVPAASALAEGRWEGTRYAYAQAGVELGGCTVGLIGLGGVGERVARILGGFGARVLGYDPYADARRLREVLGVEMVPLQRLLAEADVVSLHARLTHETYRVIGAQELAQMKSGAYLVNTARGGLLDYAALLDALRSGHLSGAALDVYDREPPDPDDPLLRLPQVTATPHLAGSSRQAAENGAHDLAAEVGRFVRGEALRSCLNPSVLGSPREAGTR